MDLLNQQCSNTSTGTGNAMIMHLVSSLLTNYCNTSPEKAWPEDYGPQAIENGNDTYDFIVIGAGSAGSVVASRLSEDPNIKVLLIEAGVNPPVESEIPSLGRSLQGSSFDWNYNTISNGNSCLGWKNNNCIWTKGKILGGTGAINGMLYVRGNSRDYDGWEKMGNPSWNWKTVMQYFKLSENFKGRDPYHVHGRNGPLSVESFRTPKNYQNTIIKAAKELGYEHVSDFSTGSRPGFGFLYGTMVNGRRCSAAKAYLRVKRDNLHIIKNAVAKKINFSADKKAESVTFVINELHELTMAASKEIVLSAGTIESPKLLMLSGVGPKDHLRKLGIPIVYEAPIGETLQDHTGVIFFLRLKDHATGKTADLDAIYDEWVHNEGRLGVSTLNLAGYVNTRRDSSFPNIQFAYLPVGSVDGFSANLKKSIRDSIRKQIGPGDRLLVAIVNLVSPRSRGTVRLSSPNYKDKPLITPNYLGNEDDIKEVVEGIQHEMEFGETKTFKEWRTEFLKIDLPDCDKFQYKSDDYWACYAKHMTSSIYHDVGSVKMGPSSDPEASVDHNLRVYGVEGLRVIDASIMPNIVSANPNAPTIMIAEKGVDAVKDAWSITPRGL